MADAKNARIPTESGKIKKKPIPPKHRQFGQPNGNKPNPGGWKKEDSISYQYNLLLRMTPRQFERYQKQDNLTMAQKIAIKRIQASLEDNSRGLSNTVEITDRTEGKAKQAIEMQVEETARNPFEGLSEEELRKLISK